MNINPLTSLIVSGLLTYFAIICFTAKNGLIGWPNRPAFMVGLILVIIMLGFIILTEELFGLFGIPIGVVAYLIIPNTINKINESEEPRDDFLLY